MDRILRMLLAGMSETEIRDDLNRYLATQKQSGGIGERGSKTYGMAVGILASWFSPAKELLGFRDAAVALARILPEEMWISLHWSVISASYPFWFSVAKQVGRLLNLQDQITQAQVFNRIKEQYGDRETVARNARYAVRSLVAWGVLRDSEAKGCYERGVKLTITNRNLTIMMLESALYATPESKSTLGYLLNHPAFFPFQFPILNGDFISRYSDRMEVISYGLDENLLKLKGL